MAQYRQINVRSPFYVQLPTSQPIVELEVRVWYGDVTSDKPTDATYVLTRESVGGEATFEIAELVRDYCSQTSSSSSGKCWVETSLDDFNVAASFTTYLATEGYTLYTEGLQHNGNTWQTDYALLPADEDGNYRVTNSENSNATFDVLVNAEVGSTVTGTGTVNPTQTSKVLIGTGTLFTTELTIGQQIDIGGNIYTVESISSDTALIMEELYSAPTGSLLSYDILPTPYDYTTYYTTGSSIDSSFSPSTTSTGLIRTVGVSATVDRVEFNVGGEQFTVYNDVFDCNKWNNSDALAQTNINGQAKPVKLYYVNKFGGKNTFHFTLKHTEQINSSSDSFNRNTADFGNLNASNGLHATRKRITGSKQSFVINTDYISEYYVKQLEELILSEYVWAQIPHISDNYIPVNLKDSKISKKTHLNDRLIQYTMNIETAAEYLNNVR